MPWLEDLKFPRGYQMGTHKLFYITQKNCQEKEKKHRSAFSHRKDRQSNFLCVLRKDIYTQDGY